MLGKAEYKNYIKQYLSNKKKLCIEALSALVTKDWPKDISFALCIANDYK